MLSKEKSLEEMKLGKTGKIVISTIASFALITLIVYFAKQYSDHSKEEHRRLHDNRYRRVR